MLPWPVANRRLLVIDLRARTAAPFPLASYSIEEEFSEAGRVQAKPAGEFREAGLTLGFFFCFNAKQLLQQGRVFRRPVKVGSQHISRTYAFAFPSLQQRERGRVLYQNFRLAEVDLVGRKACPTRG